jgi:histidine triad (HIT) family protein
MENCIFCKIVAGEIPCYKIYEDADFLAFLDIQPFNPGHVLVIPKKHFRWVWDVSNVGSYYELAAKIALAQKKALNTDYVVSLVMGQQVPHAHIHLVPRFANDGHEEGVNPKNIKEISKEEMLEIAEKIKKSLQ